MLTLERVTYRYPGTARAALSDIELSIAEGEVIGIAGANESGKSTLALVASGLAPSSVGGTISGRVLVDGTDLSGRPMHEIAPLVGICFQNPHTQLSQVADTVFEEVAFGPLNLGLDRFEVVRRVWNAATDVGIADLVERDPRRLSGGQMQLMAVAGLLAMKPRYLVLDEPTSQLDPEGKSLVVEALVRLAQGGTGMLLAEHDTNILSRLADRVAVLDEGRVVLQGNATDVLANPDLERFGIERPARVRLAEALVHAGLTVDVPG